MGKLITVWSPYHQQATTASMAAVACCMSQGEETVCVTHSQFARSDLEGIFRGRLQDVTTEQLYSSKGLAGLLLKTRLTPVVQKEDVLRCAFDEDWNGVRLLSGIHHEYPLHNDELYIYRTLTGAVKDAFDYTFVDAAGGMVNNLSKNLICASDLVIVVLQQSERVIADFVANGLPEIDASRGDVDYEANDGEDIHRGLAPYKVLIGNYSSHARGLKTQNIALRYGFTPMTVPRSVDFMNALNEGRISSFFAANEKAAKHKDDTYEFMRSVNKAAEEIRSALKKKVTK